MHGDLPDGSTAGGGLLADTLVELADTLGDESEPDAPLRRLAGRTVRLTGVAAAALLLADEGGDIRVISASCEPARLLSAAGPGPDCYRSGTDVGVADLGRAREPLPRDFARRARASGYAAVFAVPVRHRKEVLGALVLYRATPGLPPAHSVAVTRSLADAAAIGVLQRRTRRHHQRLAAQLQTALDSRIPVEQVKGVLAERWHVSVDDAFALLRAHARAHQIRVADLATAILAGTTTLPRPGAPT
ncbi:GAF and ANTAR domain-containing protein [Streptomyces cocklensis]|uniref:GAF domain-containing protein n=1 Tax=Actinacidiphila cocklensis TaxID=887465 RepID=A0A9W4DSV3_9ACTN|nr:GAF and ANTAR domain-containing protein [Actinacidiphila cocklensis]MDD1058280.1 GAF and ANTAR domain-containing protein [Actinacidiphila cocklensis]WSX79312.1 GAF and ANTAR domain-containing protein [Streptomyces sp. NBC_00899]CAG6393339.1 GAF domain-containing protein [Actinacidiphila cocklensis]